MAGNFIDGLGEGLNYIKMGQKKEDIKNDPSKINIFESLDKNGNGIIEENDLQKVKDLADGKYLVKSKDGSLYVVNENGEILNSAQAAIFIAKQKISDAKESLETQHKKDGWAGKTADAVSTLWNSKNRYKIVTQDLEKHASQIAQLVKVCDTKSPEFAKKFEETFKVPYNENSVLEYLENPNEETYMKAFGSEVDVTKRVEKYNRSQEVGAEVVKAGAAVGVGIATGGAGLVAAGAIAAGTGIALNVTDKLTSDDGIEKGDLKEILKEGAIDGAITAATMGAGKAIKVAKVAAKSAKAAKAASTAANTASTATKSTSVAASTAAKTGQRTVNINGKVYKVATPQPRTAGVASTAQKSASTSSKAGVIKADGMEFRIKPKTAANTTPKAQAAATPKPTDPPVKAEAPKPQTSAKKAVEPTKSQATAQKTAPAEPSTPKATAQKAAPKSKIPTEEEIDKELDELISKQQELRAPVKQQLNKQYGGRLSSIEAKQTELETQLAEQKAAYPNTWKEKFNAIGDSKNLLTEEQKVLESLTKRHAKLEQDIIKYKSALRDLEKQQAMYVESRGAQGGKIDELYLHAKTKPKKFIGAEFKNNIDVKVTPENTASYYYEDDIAELFHNYNITQPQNKAAVVEQLRAKTAEMEKKLASVESKITAQQNAVENATAKYNSAQSSFQKLEKEHKQFLDNYKTTKAQLEQEKSEIQATIDNTMKTLENSDAYRKLVERADELKNLWRSLYRS